MPPLSNSPVIRLHNDDNVAVAKEQLPSGQDIVHSEFAVNTKASIPAGHKVAIRQIMEGDPIIKFGQPIGYASQNIAAAEWVHVHNVVATKPGLNYAFSSDLRIRPVPEVARTFDGFGRANGKAGTRNYIAVISTVNCCATTPKYVAKELSETDLSEYPNIDGIVPLVHKSGCALAFGGEDHLQLNRTMAGFAAHPNIVACIILGLGCETAQATHLEREHGLVQLGGQPWSLRRSVPMTKALKSVAFGKPSPKQWLCCENFFRKRITSNVHQFR